MADKANWWAEGVAKAKLSMAKAAKADTAAKVSLLRLLSAEASELSNNADAAATLLEIPEPPLPVSIKRERYRLWTFTCNCGVKTQFKDILDLDDYFSEDRLTCLYHIKGAKACFYRVDVGLDILRGVLSFQNPFSMSTLADCFPQLDFTRAVSGSFTGEVDKIKASVPATAYTYTWGRIETRRYKTYDPVKKVYVWA